MADVNLILGDNSGTPPTGNIVRLYDYWSGVAQIGAFPSDIQVPDDKQITRLEQLDGVGVLQYPPNDYREGYIEWEMLDLNTFNVSGAMIYELKARRYVLTELDYFIGAVDMGGAYFLRENPLQIRIIDVESELIPNAANRKFANVRLRFHRV